jgi:hypothetical protein
MAPFVQAAWIAHGGLACRLIRRAQELEAFLQSIGTLLPRARELRYPGARSSVGFERSDSAI